MNQERDLLNRKIGDIQFGLLRFSNKDVPGTIQVRAVMGENDSLNCIVISDNTSGRLLNRKVSLVQVKNDDYLYISGYISGEVEKSSKIISLAIAKACWYTRKKKGSVTWLQEKYIYENMKQLKAS